MASNDCNVMTEKEEGEKEKGEPRLQIIGNRKSRRAVWCGASIPDTFS